MKIALASDHSGFELKTKIKDHLLKQGIGVLDLGCSSTEPVSYAEYGRACGIAVIKKEADIGIVVCGTGVGVSIAANRIKGIRCALCTDLTMAEKSRRFTDANVLALGSGTLTREIALQIVDLWINTEFEGGRHQHSVDLLDWE